MTLDEVKGHIEYMKRQNRLYEEVYSKEGKKRHIPFTGSRKWALSFAMTWECFGLNTEATRAEAK